MTRIRPAYFAGQFYSADPQELQLQIETYLRRANVVLPPSAIPKALLVPHAGYVFSGTVAAYAYATLINQDISRVFLLGNSHLHYFDGIAVDSSDYWQTPLGKVSIDTKEIERLSSLNTRIFLDSDIHLGDHILEVQLPFLQVALKSNFKIIPIIFGNSSQEDHQELAQILQVNFRKGDLVIASSDLSHYPNYEMANQIDIQTLKIIKNKDIFALNDYIANIESQNIPNEETVMCGPDAVKTVMLLADHFHWSGEILKYGNSGDVPVGEKERVVGYGALVFYEK